MRPLTHWITGSALALLSLSATACMAKERATVSVAYVIGPPAPLPEGLSAVAVIDAGVKTEGTQENAREQKWSAMAADMVEAMLQNAGAEFGSPLAVAKRSQTQRILEEKDLRLAGLVEGAEATRAGKLLAVQGLITSRIVIHLDVTKGSKSTVDWAGILGGVVGGLNDRDRNRRDVPQRRPAVVVRRVPADPRARGPRDPRARPRTTLYRQDYRPTRSPRPAGGAFGGGIEFKTREVEEISRSLTVQCSFSLIDATTGQALTQYSPPPYQKTDSASPDFLFGGMVDEADLDPVDHFIGELVERATQEFVGMLVPVRVEQEYSLELSGKRGEAAIRALRADDFDAAMQNLDAVAGGKDDDEGEYSFAAGVVCELMGNPEKALKLYRQASAAPDVDEDELPKYLAAKKRLTEHLGRMLSPEALKARIAAPVPAGGSPPPPPPASPPAEAAPPPQTSPATVEDEMRLIKELEEKEKQPPK